MIPSTKGSPGSRSSAEASNAEEQAADEAIYPQPAKDNPTGDPSIAMNANARYVPLELKWTGGRMEFLLHG